MCGRTAKALGIDPYWLDLASSILDKKKKVMYMNEIIFPQIQHISYQNISISIVLLFFKIKFLVTKI